MIYVILIWAFMKIGLFAVGGGPATIPFLMDLIEKYHWYTEEEFTNLIAISQSTPGPVGVNMATYSGYLTAGVFGGVVATIALVFPSVVIIIIIAKFLGNFSQNKGVQGVFSGLRPAVTGLITTSVIGIIQIAIVTKEDSKNYVNGRTLALFLLIFILMQVKRLQQVHPGIWMLGAAVIGILLF